MDTEQRTFEGSSDHLDQALQEAVKKAAASLPMDATVKWSLSSIKGERQGMTGLHTVTVAIQLTHST